MEVKGTASRVPGRGRLLQSLRALIRRAERFAAHRAETADEHLWAQQFCDALDGVWAVGTRTEAARRALEAVDCRVDRSRKTPMSDPGRCLTVELERF